MTELKSGYTTGTCAAIATKAALRMIFEKKIIPSEKVITPKGIEIYTAIENSRWSDTKAQCAVRKDAGDDPDVTNGILVYSDVTLTPNPIVSIDGGIGVGRVTKPGLQQKIGDAAINNTPKKMILGVVHEMMDAYGYEGGANIVISIPEGVEIAKKTFNPRLGIEGGISVLGTSGIVEPMSEQALIDTIKVEIDVKRETEGEFLMISPGNYGIDFIRNTFNVNLEQAVKCSNYVGETLDYIRRKNIKGILLIGHIGKFVKLAGGIMNTHSKNADSRMEIIAANAALETDNISIVRQIMECVTTDDALSILKREGILESVMERICTKAQFYVQNRMGSDTEVGILIFSNEFGILAQSKNTENLMNHFRR